MSTWRERRAGRPRRRRSLVRRLVTAFLVTALGAILVVGAYHFFEARRLLDDSVRDSLDSLQSGRALALADGLERVRSDVVLVGVDPTVIAGVADLAGAWATLRADDDLLDEAGEAEVDAFYADLATTVDATELGLPDIRSLRPGSEAGRYLQLQWTIGAGPDGREVDSVGDGTTYDTVHARVHPYLRGTADRFGFADVLVVDADTRAIVYSVEKRVDLGASLGDGPLRESGLGRAVIEQLARVPIGDAAFVDVEPYLPAGGQPVFFIAVAVRDEGELLGAVVAEVPIDGLNRLTSAGGRWDELGLGGRGEVYVVGSDLRLRSDSRLWQEDPEAYLAATDDRTAALVAALQTTAGVQPADTRAVGTAFEGDRFSGRTENYLGQGTFTVAAPVGLDGLDWVVVADIGIGDANRPLWRYLERIGLLLVVMVPLVIAAAVLLGRRLTRPVRPLVAATTRIGDGDLETPVETGGAGELADVGLQLDELRVRLGEQRAVLAAEDAEITDILRSAMPAYLAERVRGGTGELAEEIESVTVVSVTVTGLVGGDALDLDVALDLAGALATRLAAVAREHGLTVLRPSLADFLVAAGIRQEGTGAADAVAFVEAASAATRAFGLEHGLELVLGAGMASGDAAVAVVQGAHLSLAIWGQPLRVATALDAAAAAGQILVHGSTAAGLGDTVVLEPVAGLLDLHGEAVDAASLAVGQEA